MQQAISASSKEISPLRHYTLAKQEVATAVRTAKQFFEAANAREASEQCQALIVQLAEDRFNLAVVGQFKRGKSTLMNAVLGRDLLPTGLLPLTSAITTLCYGSTERVVLRRKGWGLEQEVPLAQLAAFITERGNPGNEKGLMEARVELPLPFLRSGLHFLDTPGIGSARNENTMTTYAFLPHMDAVICVTSCDAPLSEAEQRFLVDIRQQVRQLFVIVNKMDMLGDTEREEVFNYIQRRLEYLLGPQAVHLFPLSARAGLTAKQNRDEASLLWSGLASFEQVLTTFLAEEQGRTFLVSILDRALRLLASAERMPPTPADEGEHDAPKSGLELQQLMESLRTSLLTGTPLSTVHPAPVFTPADSQIIDQTIATSHAQARKVDGEHTHLSPRTCPICTAQGQALFAFFARWQYTLASDAMAQRVFAAEHGLCPVHTWQFQEMGSPQGISEGYAPLIELLAHELSCLVEHSTEDVVTHVTTLLSKMATCAACRLVRETASEQAKLLLSHFGSVQDQANDPPSVGLCLPHLQEVLTHLEQSTDETNSDNRIATFLLCEQVQRLEELADDLRSYVLKRDALRQGLLHGEEADAWRRALVQLVGERAARGGTMAADPGILSW